MSLVLSSPFIDEIVNFINTCKKNNISLGLAESCTGGLASALLTQQAGVSSIYKGSCITYSNESKVDLLGVPFSMIQEWGAVSEPVAQSMCLGLQKKLGVTLSLAITGIAGPTGGTIEKPVGTVCFALRYKKNEILKTHFFQGDRPQIQWQAAHYVWSLAFELVVV